VATLEGHTDLINSLSFSPDGTRLATASNDYTVKLWDTATGNEVLTLKGHSGPVLAVAFDPVGNQLASASRDKEVIVWDARPATLERLAEREALNLIHFLDRQGKPKSEWLSAISEDQTISEAVRQRAAQFARAWK
jgi:WD40 repeat protein